MNYEIFDRLDAGTLFQEAGETEQHFMERVYTAFCGEEGAPCGLIGMLRPEFIACSAEHQTLTLGYAAEDWTLNPKRMLHGGMTATMLDNTLSLAARFYCRTNALSTVSLAVNYLRPVSAGEHVTVFAQVDKLGHRILFLSGCVYTQDGKKAATATGSFMVL